jgi:hypothetical protein
MMKGDTTGKNKARYRRSQHACRSLLQSALQER